MKTTTFFSIIFVLLCSTGVLKAQFNVNDVVLENSDTFVSPIINGFSESILDYPAHGSVSLIDAASGFIVNYSPESSFEGYDTMVIEYIVPNNFNTVGYHKYVFDVRNSIVELTNDFYTIINDGSSHILDVLSNDNTTKPNNTLKDVVLTQNGVASIKGSQLEYTPPVFFSGLTNIIYSTEDAVGSRASANCKILVLQQGQVLNDDTIHLYTLESQPVDFFVPDTNYQLVDSPSKGYITTRSNKNFLIYNPFQTSQGKDKMTFSMGNNSRTVVCHILEDEDMNNKVFDDFVYTPKDESVVFNVIENDALPNGRISSYTYPQIGQLIKVSRNSFEYIPQQSYEGDVRFTYTSCLNGDCETGDVTVYVGNLNPNNSQNYELVTPKNRPLLLNYEVPISNFSFSLLNNATNGVLTINPGRDTLQIGCEQVIGNNLVVYNPNQDFVGFDEFDLEYCVNGDCEIVKVKVNVIDKLLDSVCVCADDCIWPGDIDYDGEVNLNDLLALGWHFGQTGPQRPLGSDSDWYGQYGPDWSSNNVLNENLKHADSNADGIINAADTSSIVKFYKRVHTLLADPVFDPIDYPVFLRIKSPQNPQIGDRVFVEVVVGTEAFPARNIHGLNLQFDFDPRIIDTNTLNNHFVSTSWFADQEACIDLSILSGARVNTAVTRALNVSKSGYGVVFQSDFVIEDDLDGLRLSESSGKLITSISFSGTILNGEGKYMAIPLQTIPLEIELNKIEKGFEIITYPNPVRDLTNILINRGEISSIKIFDILGRLVVEKQNVNTDNYQLNLSNLSIGSYFIQVTDENGNISTSQIQAL